MSSKKTEPEKGILRTLDDFWFGKGSPTSIGVFRIFMGSLIFINLLMISLDWDAWFSSSGFVPPWIGELWVGGPVSLWPGTELTLPRINLLSGITNDYVGLGFYILVTFFALTTALGLWTRVSTICLAIGIVSLHHRNGLILHGGDTVMRVMALYMAVAPSGAACSLDRMIRLWKGKESGAPVQVSLWPQRLIMYNMALIYFTTVWLKWGGDLWRDGTATWYPARLAEFYRFPIPNFVNEFPFVYLTTYGTLLVEFALGTIVFYKPLRKYVLLAGLLMHGWIEYSMNIPLFSYLMVSMYICFYEGDEVQAWFKRLGERLKRFAAIIRLPQGQQLDPKGVAFFDSADPLKLVTYLPGDEPELTKSAVKKSWTRSMGAWIMAWIPGLWRRLLLRSLVSAPLETSAPDRPKQAKKAKA